jgi:hypothetical protein
VVGDAMSDRIEQVAAGAIRAGFQERGSAQVAAGDLRLPPERWRAIARKVGRELGRGVQTLESDGSAWAVLRDWPRDEREQGIHDAALRAASAAAALHPPRTGLRPIL